MFQQSDINQINERGSDLNVVKIQIENFKRGFPFLKVKSAATPDDGIIIMDEKKTMDLIRNYDEQSENKQIVKFVPASGAASRMFKLLFSFLEISNDASEAQKQLSKSDDLQSISTFFSRIN